MRFRLFAHVIPYGLNSVISRDKLTPREALRCLQEEARLSPQQAEGYLDEVRENRLVPFNQPSKIDWQWTSALKK
jgi:hypothetical protein